MPAPTRAAPIAAEVVRRLFVLFKAASVYSPTNEGYRAHAEEAKQTLADAFSEGGDVRLSARGDQLFFNELPIRLTAGADAGGRSLLDEFQRRGVGVLEFSAKGALPQLDAFAFAFQKVHKGQGLAELRRQMREARVTAIAAGPPEPEYDSGKPQPDSGTAARKTFFRAVALVEMQMQSLREGESVDLEQAKAVVDGLADQVVRDEQALFELSAIRHFDEYTYAHCVNVCVYSIALGVRLGLERPLLSELGFCGLFHDAGKARLARKLINKPDPFTEEEWRQIRRHPVLGAKTLLGLRRPVDRSLARAVVVSFEHHQGFDGAGYPKLARRRPQDVFTRVCAIADAFDAMTSGRVYAKEPTPPDQALRRMAVRAGKDFDTLLLRLFIGVAGVYPIGTVLRLNTGELAVVRRNLPGELMNPQIVVFSDGRDRKPPEEVNLAAPPEEGKPARAIAQPVDPRPLGVEVRDVLSGR